MTQGMIDLLMKLETQIILKAVTPGFWLSDQELADIVKALKFYEVEHRIAADCDGNQR